MTTSHENKVIQQMISSTMSVLRPTIEKRELCLWVSQRDLVDCWETEYKTRQEEELFSY